jgi:hypothetical protein
MKEGLRSVVESESDLGCGREFVVQRVQSLSANQYELESGLDERGLYILLQFEYGLQDRLLANSQHNLEELAVHPHSVPLADLQARASKVSTSSFFQQHPICNQQSVGVCEETMVKFT